MREFDIIGGILVVTVLFVSLTLYADTIKLVTGTEMKGKIVEDTDEAVKLETDSGTLTIPKNAIEEIIKEDKKEEPEKTEEKKRGWRYSPDVVEFILKDNSIMYGKITQKQFTITTSYGALTIPIEKIRSVKIGKRADTVLRLKIIALTQKLGSADIKSQEEATKKLIELGTKVLTDVRKLTESSNEALRERAEKICQQIERTRTKDEKLLLDDDVIETEKFTIIGNFELPPLETETKYGEATIAKSQIVEIRFNIPPSQTKYVTITGSHSGAISTGIEVAAGDTITITATGYMTSSYSDTTFGPEGDSSYSSTDPRFNLGTLTGRISNGALFKVGKKYTGSAINSGTIMIQVFPYRYGSLSGQYKVKIVVEKR